MLTLLDTILKPGSLTPVFQPIFEVHGEERKLHSLECLMRGPKGTSVERADIMFAYVRRKREEISVDRARSTEISSRLRRTYANIMSARSTDVPLGPRMRHSRECNLRSSPWTSKMGWNTGVREPGLRI